MSQKYQKLKTLLMELVVRFTYQPDPTKQKELNATAEAVLLETSGTELVEWIRELRAPHRRADGTDAGTRLRVHLDRYTARNSRSRITQAHVLPGLLKH